MKKVKGSSQKRKIPQSLERKESGKAEPKVTQSSDGKFADQQFGELNLGKVGNVKVYCLADVYRILGVLHRDGDEILKKYGCYTVPLLVKRRVITRSYMFTDYDGLLTILIETRKTKANTFKRWIDDKERTCEICEAGVKISEAEESLKNKPLTDDMYPTLGVYFRDYVPAEYFAKILKDTIKDYSKKSEKSCSGDDLNEVMFRTGVLSTFSETLDANLRKVALG